MLSQSTIYRIYAQDMDAVLQRTSVSMNLVSTNSGLTPTHAIARARLASWRN
jgi:hypothetical protein